MILQNPDVCHGCRWCELMCSFHHSRAFSPRSSSIEVVKDNATGTVQWSVRESCDMCIDEDRLFCVTYCPYGALRRSR